MLDTLKALFSSIWGCFIFTPLFIGSLWCLFFYGSIGLLYPASYVVAFFLVLYKRERSRDKLMMKADLQIDSNRQMKAIDEYVALINKNKKKKTEKKVS